MKKSPNAKPTKVEVTAAKDSAATDSIVPSRPILGSNVTVSAPMQDEAPAPAPEPILAQQKRTVINPVNNMDDIKASTQETTSANSTNTNDSEDDSTKITVTRSSQPKLVEDKENMSNSSSPKETNQATTNADSAASDKSESDETNGQSPDQPSKEALKAIAEAKEAEKRDQKVQEYIDNRQFFVPINSVAQKKSIKISGLMTVAIFLLALVLIDLLLDTGAIFFVQRIPHTHFFTVQSNQP